MADFLEAFVEQHLFSHLMDGDDEDCCKGLKTVCAFVNDINDGTKGT